MAINRTTKKVDKLKTKSERRGVGTALFLYGTILGLYIYAGIAHEGLLDGNKSKVGSETYEKLNLLKDFRHYFFTGWNSILQISFLVLAITDEISKLANFSKIQASVEKVRLFLFSSLVFPSTLLVMTIFWGIWHIDRELIFPKVIDSFYPVWLNHTLHTLIIVPLFVEVALQFKKANYQISRITAASVLVVYCIVYQSLYMSIYFKHGVWLYPVYNVLTWNQRVAFFLGQFVLLLLYQQLGISLLRSKEVMKAKSK